jgi:hypothetical protein
MHAEARAESTNPIRAALEQAMVSPRVQQAVAVFVNALVDEGEALLKLRYAGETLRIYTPKRYGRQARLARDRRIQALATEPGCTPMAQIAAAEGISGVSKAVKVQGSGRPGQEGERDDGEQQCE